MLQLQSISLSRGTKTLFDDVSVSIFAGQKIGLVGANGSGKSSLFSLIRQQITADKGEISRPKQLRMAHVKQETPALDRKAIDYVLDGHHELRDVQNALAIAEDEHDDDKIIELHSRLDDLRAYELTASAAKLLAGLGFSAQEQEKTVAEFSGGWRVRLNIAQALMTPADLLLLDEPTNHLDLDAIIWLGKWLKRYEGAILLISHDRDFLDDIVGHIFHIENQTVTDYTGNYSDFERIRAEQLALQQATYEKQQKAVVHMMKFVDRFKAKATKAKQAQSRLKAIERMELVSAVQVSSPFHFEFPPAKAASDPLLTLRHAQVAYDEKIILNNINLEIAAGNRIGLLGPNGAGKSTLVKLIADVLPLKHGERFAANKNLVLAYFSQHQVDDLDLSASPLAHIVRLSPQTTEQQARNFLGGFAFSGDMALSSIENFSGGEKSRLALALLVWQKPNLLLLDEPTNHLDLEMRSALELALQSYEGALVVVSHDRHLLRSAVDEFYLVYDQKVERFKGDLEDYERWLVNERKQTNKEEKSETISNKDNFESRKDVRRRQEKSQRLEKKIEQLSQQLHELDHQLADNTLYQSGNQEKLIQIQQKKQKVQDELSEAEAGWFELHD